MRVNPTPPSLRHRGIYITNDIENIRSIIHYYTMLHYIKTLNKQTYFKFLVHKIYKLNGIVKIKSTTLNYTFFLSFIILNWIIIILELNFGIQFYFSTQIVNMVSHNLCMENICFKYLRNFFLNSIYIYKIRINELNI